VTVESDQNILARGICPDCGQLIRKYFVVKSQPWCEGCDQYFSWIGETLVRNTGATKEFNDHWRGLVEVGRWVEPIIEYESIPE
jgi:hypothetical protein